MTVTRRNVLLGATAAAALLPIAARAQTSEVVIGVIYPLSGASAQIGIDAQKALETAADIINNNYDLDLPLARGEGLPGLGGAKIRLVFADHQGDPQKGRAEAERLITQEKVVRDHRHLSERGRGHRQPDLRALPDSVHVGGQFLAQPASPRAEILFPRRARTTRCSRRAMFDFFDAMKKNGTKIETVGAVPRGHHLRHRFRQRAAQARRRARLQGASRTSNTAPTRRRCPPKCSSSRPPMPTC